MHFILFHTPNFADLMQIWRIFGLNSSFQHKNYLFYVTVKILLQKKQDWKPDFTPEEAGFEPMIDSGSSCNNYSGTNMAAEASLQIKKKHSSKASKPILF